MSGAAPSTRWTATERASDLAVAEREGLDLLVIGGGITGAGVLRDAATRGLRALLVERGDFASGTSGRSSKLVHGGLRYIGEGQLRTTREACAERDRLARLNSSLVRPMPFLLPAYRDGRVPLWQVRAALGVYATLASFRRSARFRILRPDRVPEWSRDLRRDELAGAGLYWDSHVDDARLVLETLRSARALGAGAVSRAEVDSLAVDERGEVSGVRVRDRQTGRTATLRASVVVNAAGPSVERVRGFRGPLTKPELRPAKGVHLVIRRERLHLRAAVSFESPDGRHLFAAPWDDVVLIGTTDSFSDEIDAPVVTIEEAHYLLSAANLAFPDSGLTTNDLCSVYAGVRPLAADSEDAVPSNSVSREDRVYHEGALISAIGGKLTTYRAMAERIVDRVVAALPHERRRAAARCRTRELPLRNEDFDAASLETELDRRFGVGPIRARHLVTHYGAEALPLLTEAPADCRAAVGSSRFTYAEIGWSFATQCAETLCDLLERRMRMAVYAPGQGLAELPRIAAIAAEAGGWDADRTREEARAYAASVRRHYQIALTRAEQSAA